MVICEVFTGKLTPLTEEFVPPSTLDHLTGLVEALTHFWYQNSILLGDLHINIQDHKQLSQHVAELLMEFGLVYLRYHLGRAGGSDTGNVVSYTGRQIVGENMGKHIWDKGTPRRNGGNQGWE